MKNIHQLLEYMFELVFMFDAEGNLLHANRAAQNELGYGDEITSANVSDILPKIYEKNGSEFVVKEPADGESKNAMLYRKNNTCFPAEIKIIPENEEKTVFICFASDTTRQEALKKQIAVVKSEADEAMKVKSEFVANVTHELRTPVNGILGNTHELLESETDEKKLRILRLIERGCQNMHTVINNVLDFSKLDAGKFTLDPREFDFRGMIDYVKANHTNLITEKGLDFFVTVSPEVPEHIIGDELRIVQILNNLLSNATKFTSIGKITLEVVKTAQMENRAELFFIVIDTGIGVDKAQQDKLFQSFSQADASISRKYGGTGLGLSISKQLVELMGGTISVQSEVGKGTMFSFSIWVDLPEGEEASAAVDVVDVTGLSAMFSDGGQSVDDSRIWGSAKNREEITGKMSKLILSVEMDNWEKAETFMEILRQLTEDAPREVKTGMLKLKMAVQKANHEKTVAAYETLQELLG